MSQLTADHNATVVSRNAFTLIELMVVIAIMIALTITTLAFYPSRTANSAIDGVNQLKTYVSTAKSRAMRDREVRGIRLIHDQNDPPNTLSIIQFLEIPEPFVPEGSKDPKTGIVTNNAQIQTTTGADVFFIKYDVSGELSAGDYFELSGEQSPHKIVKIWQVAAQWWAVQCVSPITQTTTRTDGYKFIRHPRPLLGEPTLHLPRDVSVSSVNGLNMPTPNPDGSYDILFTSSGQVLYPLGGRIVLWISNHTNPQSVAPQLLCIYTRTGGLAIHPVQQGANPYGFTQDGR